MIAALEYPRKY